MIGALLIVSHLSASLFDNVHMHGNHNESIVMPEITAVIWVSFKTMQKCFVEKVTIYVQ